MLLFSRVVFSNPFSKNIDDTIRVLEEINWNPRAVNSYPFIHHSADNFTGCLLLVCALMSFEFFIWSSWSFSKILNTIFLDNITMFQYLYKYTSYILHNLWCECREKLFKSVFLIFRWRKATEMLGFRFCGLTGLVLIKVNLFNIIIYWR